MAGTPPALVAPEADTKWYEGAGLVESTVGSVDSVLEGDGWGAAGNVVATGLGAIGAVMDPLQAVFAAGVGWLMEHVSFLREPLDALCGDPKEIEGHAQTWRNIQAQLYAAVTDFVSDVKSSTAEWTMKAADAYRHRAAEHALAVRTLGESCEYLAKSTLTAGALIGVVRNTIRDIIAEVVGAAISKALQSLLVVTIPKIVAEVALLVAECTAKIMRMLQRLTSSIGKLTAKLGDLGGLVDTLGVTFRETAHNARILGTYRFEAAATYADSPATSLRGYASAYRTAFTTISDGHTAVHGTLPTVVQETAVNSARSNSAQNSGATIGKMDGKEPPPIDLPL